jgi:hypothetical protein
MAGERGGVDGLADQLIDVIVGEGRHGDGSAAAHGGEKGNFVAGAERSIPGSKFLVAGGDNRGAVFCKLGVARGVMGEELLDGRGIGEFKRILDLAGEFLEAAEKEDLDANRLGDWWHRGIVTRGA